MGAGENNSGPGVEQRALLGTRDSQRQHEGTRPLGGEKPVQKGQRMKKAFPVGKYTSSPCDISKLSMPLGGRSKII